MHFFKQYTIVEGKDRIFYMYAPYTQQLCHSTLSLMVAKEWIIDKLGGVEIRKLLHSGITLLHSEMHDKLYILSVKTEGEAECRKAYNLIDALRWNGKLVKYLHNVNGPAFLGIEDGLKKYYYNGQELNEEQWKKCVHDDKFNNKLDAWIDS